MGFHTGLGQGIHPLSVLALHLEKVGTPPKERMAAVPARSPLFVMLP